MNESNKILVAVDFCSVAERVLQPASLPIMYVT